MVYLLVRDIAIAIHAYVRGFVSHDEVGEMGLVITGPNTALWSHAQWTSKSVGMACREPQREEGL